jgi:phosphohistidine phosphatase
VGSRYQKQRNSTIKDGQGGVFEMAMYFVQHGLALEKEENTERPLSAEGRLEVECISAHLRKAGVTVKIVCHSGKTRARETAQIFADQIGDGNVLERSGMAPKDDVKAFAALLETDDTMCVGHLPHMGKLVSYLTTGDEDAGVVRFTNGAVVCVEKSPSGFYIEWFLKPSICNG